MSSTRQKLIAGNWKMNCSRAQAIELASAVDAGSVSSDKAKMLICTPAIHFADISKVLSGSHIALGAQDAHWQVNGAYTGEISSAMLADYQVSYLLVGHSERREMFADDNQRVAKKFAAALENNITPILCIGESLTEREQGVTLAVLKEQCQAVIDTVGIQAFSKACLAYEPIWAIGTGLTATPEQAQQTHQQLREYFASQDAVVAESLQILYGGSMNASNAEELLAQPDIDGGLIGGASLKSEDFVKIYSLAGQ
jgi:triosephosphate isomerase (TIM)